ncbi:collagenase-like [Drosophila obscura]|uniref:collagenase-like n=1 Tax=Drosophila obscura TaxID=7282 RepID=UPI001BB0FAEE|nr:collagenase-like [Drosophila obscura]
MEGRIVLVLIACGLLLKLSNGSNIQRIINGGNATAKQFPYQVYYETFSLDNYDAINVWKYECGGTIISSKIVLTAAHCLQEPNIKALKIFFGAVDKSNANEKGQQPLIVDRKFVVIHEQFEKDVPYYNDIAIIKLPIDVPFNEFIRPAKPPQPTNNYVNAKAIVSGWGAHKVSETKTLQFPSQLKYFEINIISNEECEEKWKRLVSPRIFPASFICTGPSENSPCRGDSGGPLVLQEGEDYILLGVTSHGLSTDCKTNLPTVFTRVSSFLDWIQEHSGGKIWI